MPCAELRLPVSVRFHHENTGRSLRRSEVRAPAAGPGKNTVEWVENAGVLKQITADVLTLMAGDTAHRLEIAVALHFISRQRGTVARQPAIETAARRNQRPLIRTMASSRFALSAACP